MPANPDDIDAKIDALRERREAANAELKAVDAELGAVFAEVVAESLDLKAKAKRADVSRTTAYKLVGEAGQN